MARGNLIFSWPEVAQVAASSWNQRRVCRQVYGRRSAPRTVVDSRCFVTVPATSAGSSIDRMGNGRVRCLLVEAVWRFLQWQPQWKAAARMEVKLAAGSALRKKTVVALARLLAIDLWRWRTDRATLEDLGWVAA